MFPQLILIHLLCLLGLTTSSTFDQTKSGCQAKCGNVDIPYPFSIAVDGVDKGCSIAGVGQGYNINCNTTYNPHKPFLNNLEIMSISDSEIHVKSRLASGCNNQSSGSKKNQDYRVDLGLTNFTFSDTKNKFFSLGCNALGTIVMYRQAGGYYFLLCSAGCGPPMVFEEGESCPLSSGCCSDTIGKGVNKFAAWAEHFENPTNKSSYSSLSCGHSFMAEQARYTFSATDLNNTKFRRKHKDIPLVLEWAIGNKSCEDAKKDPATYACKDKSFCNRSSNILGYRCFCEKGYEGNPYISPGCQGLTTSSTFDQTKSGCQAKCGNVDIPYPFGIAVDGVDKGCSIAGVGQGYNINCNTTYNPHKPFLNNLEIMSISDSEIHVKSRLASGCNNQSSGSKKNQDYRVDLGLTNFTFSDTKNKFFSLGCNALGTIVMYRQAGGYYFLLCSAGCGPPMVFEEGESCPLSSGCCSDTIGKGVNKFAAWAEHFENPTNKSSYSSLSCGHSFMAEQARYTFSATDLNNTKFRRKHKDIPLVLEWAIGNKSCEDAKKDPATYACKDKSFCNRSSNILGYRCFCEKGYEGNPYISPGCQDKNECKDRSHNPCARGRCINTIGSYTCKCPRGTHDNGKTCRIRTIYIVLGTVLSLLVLSGICYWLFLSIKNVIRNKRKQKLFRDNGGLLLKQQLASYDTGVESAKIFTANELELATNNYHKDQIIGEGGYGTVYKGILSDNHIVAIKKSKVMDQSQIEQFINEVVIVIQINHRNVVKLLGCCLETKVPLLVYEYVSNGTLHQHIHSNGNEMSSISWQSRLKIATETAGALAYLHSAASIPVIHRDIKSSNILLDNEYNAKVSDFGASRLIPLEKSHFTTLVQGTLGYLDPEYFHSNLLTVKSDVYSFGVVLVELLTGKKPFSFERSEGQRNLSTYFISLLEKEDLIQILDAQVVNVGNKDQVLSVAELARRCLQLKGEERPTMKEVATELEGLIGRETIMHEVNNKGMTRI